MFSYNNYKQTNLSYKDICDGIIMWIFIILIASMIYCLININNTKNIIINFIIIIIIEGTINISKIIFILIYKGNNDDYNKIKKKILLCPIILSIGNIGYSLFNIITYINEDYISLSCTLSYIIVSLFRILNFLFS